MLEPIMSALEKQRVVLASSSPRRRELLKQVGLKFEIIPSNYEENLNPNDFSNPGEFAIATAVNKVKEVEERLMKKGESFDILIGVDTIVHMNGKIFGKPRDEDDAFRTLKMLSGNCHTVFSGVCIKTPSKIDTFSESTDVYFGNISDEVIKAYVKTGDPMDKAGGYGIQVKGGSFIEKINGDFFNVVGLPLYRFCQHLSELYNDFDILVGEANPKLSCDKKYLLQLMQPLIEVLQNFKMLIFRFRIYKFVPKFSNCFIFYCKKTIFKN